MPATQPSSHSIAIGPRREERLGLAEVKTEFHPGLRLVRTLAMLSILAHHIQWTPVLGGAFGVTSLQLVMCALQTRQQVAAPLLVVVRKRWARLLIPWLAWCGIYALFEWVEATRWEQPWQERFADMSWLAGTSFHLWFLPFAFAASLLANRLHRLSQDWPARLAIPGCAFVGGAVVLLAPALQKFCEPEAPLEYWIHGLGTIPLGVAVGRILTIRERELRSRWLLAALLLAVAPTLLGPALGRESALYDRYAFAACLAVAGFAWRGPDGRVLALFANFNLGVYLVHVFVLRGMRRFELFEGLDLLPHLLICYALCLASVWGIRRLRVPFLT